MDEPAHTTSGIALVPEGKETDGLNGNIYFGVQVTNNSTTDIPVDWHPSAVQLKVDGQTLPALEADEFSYYPGHTTEVVHPGESTYIGWEFKFPATFTEDSAVELQIDSNSWAGTYKNIPYLGKN